MRRAAIALLLAAASALAAPVAVPTTTQPAAAAGSDMAEHERLAAVLRLVPSEPTRLPYPDSTAALPAAPTQPPVSADETRMADADAGAATAEQWAEGAGFGRHADQAVLRDRTPPAADADAIAPAAQAARPRSGAAATSKAASSQGYDFLEAFGPYLFLLFLFSR